MAQPFENNSVTTNLKAEYSSPGTSKTFAHLLPSSYTATTKDKILYLSTLHRSVVQLQDEINTFLTSKMEDDKALALKAGINTDDKEEENYGEEIEEDIH